MKRTLFFLLACYVGLATAVAAPLLCSVKADKTDSTVMGFLKPLWRQNQALLIVKPEAKSSCLSPVLLLHKESPGLSMDALMAALAAYRRTRTLGYDPRQILTVVDYVKSSAEPRLWVFDMKRNKLLYKTWVSHGTKSGQQYARYFSNTVDSHASSLGVMLTGDTYEGEFGYSMDLYGLERGFNDKVYERRIIMHPAPYVDAKMAAQFQQVGRSHGCLAVSHEISKKLINLIKGGTIVVSYYPDPLWLKKSAFL